MVVATLASTGFAMVTTLIALKVRSRRTCRCSASTVTITGLSPSSRPGLSPAVGRRDAEARRSHRGPGPGAGDGSTYAGRRPVRRRSAPGSSPP